MSSKAEVRELADASASRYAIFDLSSGKPYVMVVYATEEAARLDLQDLLKPYGEGSIWRTRLCVKSTSGCRSRGPKGARCNLAEGHEGPHGEVIWFTTSGGRKTTVWFSDKKRE